MINTHSYTPKVFGIGLPKTGNTSLARFLVSQGLSGVQYPSAKIWRNLIPYQFVLDTPCNIYFRELSLLYPEAKIILTHRNDSDWKVSWQVHKDKVKPKNSWQRYLRSQITFTPSEHLKEVDSFLNDYFILNLDDLDIEGLCQYLNLPVKPYPHENVTI